MAQELQEDRVMLDSSMRQPVPANDATMGEIAMRGNFVMKGYLKLPEATGHR